MHKNAVLGIDLQIDFVNRKGALPVKGAEKDVVRIVSFIRKNMNSIGHISMSLDSHYLIHIAHPQYWQSDEGNHPQPFTTISYNDVESGKWKALYHPEEAKCYLKALEEAGKTHTIWNPHCLIGSVGQALHPSVSNVLTEWMQATGNLYEVWYKGSTSETEHYSIFKAEVPIKDKPETHFNNRLIETLNAYNRVFIVGEAADFCVANSLDDIVKNSAELAQKVIVLEDCMSWIIKDNPAAVAIFENARKHGVRFLKSTSKKLFL